MHYLMIQRNTEFWLVGPFDTYEDSCGWGSDGRNNPHDDPRWQTIALADVAAPVRVMAPDAARDYAMALGDGA